MDEEGTTSRLSRSGLLISAAAVAPVLVALVLAAIEIRVEAGRPHLPCPLYPNAVVAFAAELHEGCPLEPGDSILRVEEEGRTEAVHSRADLVAHLRDGVAARLTLRRVGELVDRRISVVAVTTPLSTAWIQLAASMLLAALLVVFVLLTAVRAGVPAAMPFALIHASMGALIVAAVAGWRSALAYPLTAIARVVLPAALVHLAFVFPRTREVAVRVPNIHRVGYGVALVLLLLELNATYRGSFSTMLLLQRIEMTATAVAITLLCFSSWLSMRESPSRLTRGQAKVFLTGLALLVTATLGGTQLGGPGGALIAVTLGAALSPLPLGYAIASHHLFDFDTAWRRAVAHVVYLSIWSGLFFVGVVLLRDRVPIPSWLRNPVVLYAGVYAVLFPLDGMRQLLKQFIERAFLPGAKTWAQLTEGRASRLAHLRDVEGIARMATALAADGAPNAGVALFLGDRATIRLAHATGPGACRDPSVAALALSVVAPAEVVDLNRVDTIEPEAAALWEAGVELAAVIATGGVVYGVLLVSPVRRGHLHPSGRLTWLRLVCVHTAGALENARLAEQLRVAEEFAIRGRMHAELAHEIGKPLGALELLAQKLAAESATSSGVAERAAAIARISGQLRDIVRGVLGAGRSLDRIDVRDLIERACREIASVHGPGAVVVRPLPELPALDRQADRALRALTNLLDNAIRASAGEDAVEITARAVASGVEIAVIDHGAGIAPEDLTRVFDAFVTLRPGGNGLGLTISRQIVEQLGGTLVLESTPGRGTTARLRLPAAPGA